LRILTYLKGEILEIAPAATAEVTIATFITLHINVEPELAVASVMAKIFLTRKMTLAQ
jgi:hypothetical protein